MTQFSSTLGVNLRSQLIRGSMSKEAIDCAFAHLRAAGIEGFRSVGYIPGKWSGVTIGAGVDLRFQTQEGLKREYNVPEEIVMKIARTGFLGKMGSDVEKEGKVANSLVLSQQDAETLSKGFVARHLAVVEDYAQKMDQRAVNVLVSLRHFAGALGNTKGRVLAREVDGRVRNLVWEAIKGKTATTEDLKGALEATRATYTAEERAIRNRITNEIDHLLGKHA